MSPGRGGKRVGAGRKPILKDAASVTLYLDQRMLDELDARAKREGVSRSDFIRSALERLAGGRRPRPRRSKTSRS